MRFDFGSTAVCATELEHVLDAVGVDASELGGDLRIEGTPQYLGSPLRVIDAGTLALAGQAVAVASLSRARSGQEESVGIDCRDVVFALSSFVHTLVDGQPATSWTDTMTTAPCRGHYDTADGRVVYMANLVPRLRKSTLRFLGLDLDADREAVAAAIRRWKGQELEDAMTAEGVPVALVRTVEEWAASEQGAALAACPLIDVATVGEAAPVPVGSADRPFAGIRVLDMTHVLAGPMITRGLAEYGADVLHLKSAHPDLKDPVAVTNELGLGKRSAVLELTEEQGRATFAELLADADVFVHSWRPGVFDRFGFSPERIAELSPGIVQVAVSCYGPQGPWAGRGGFDGLALASTGATALEAEHDHPRVTPPGVVTDALAGFLGTGVVASLLQRRAREGGSFRAELSLARIAMWLLGLGRLPVTDGPEPQLGAPRLRRLADTALGPVDHVAPAITFTHTQSLLPRVDHFDGAFWPRQVANTLRLRRPRGQESKKILG